MPRLISRFYSHSLTDALRFLYLRDKALLKWVLGTTKHFSVPCGGSAFRRVAHVAHVARPPGSESEPSNEKVCPDRAEPIKAGAKTCRYCSYCFDCERPA